MGKANLLSEGNIDCVLLTAQFIISVLMKLGLCPYIDASLPFISYGGINYTVNMIYAGLILSFRIKKHTNKGAA